MSRCEGFPVSILLICSILFAIAQATHAMAQQLPDTATVEHKLPLESPPTPQSVTAATSSNEANCCQIALDWKTIPRVRSFPRTGNFSVPPTDPGYYSLLDQLRGTYLEGQPKYPYPRFSLMQPSFFDSNNFSYLDDPKNTEVDFFDCLKRMRFGDNWLFVTGGDFRYRFENHYNARLTETNNEFDLTRVRTYGDLWYRDDLRFYAEFIGAWSSPQNLPFLPTDRNDADFLNLFVDLKLADLNGKPAYIRVGRQELLFGSQRMISPLEWGNTRRTFQGVRGFRQTENWDIDLFWVQPVIPNPGILDSVDNNQNFAGVWATHRPQKGHAIDFYYLLRDITAAATVLGIPLGNTTRNTVGARYVGNVENFLFDFEGAMQLGSQSGRDVIAGMATVGAGYNFKEAPLCPTFWAYYDFASGGNPTSGTTHTFNQHFPFGHFYLGWVDQVGRQNIHDLNLHLYLYPTKWLTSWLQFHSFWLANKNDALYNAAGLPIRWDPTGRSGSHVGEELDLVFNFHLTKHLDVLAGYSYLWGGEFLRNTASPTNAVNTSFFFLQTTYRW